jgi:Ca2+-binding EF-hand superfamily protein
MRNGRLNRADFATAVKSFAPLSKGEMDQLFTALDMRGAQSVAIEEVARSIRAQAEPAAERVRWSQDIFERFAQAMDRSRMQLRDVFTQLTQGAPLTEARFVEIFQKFVDGLSDKDAKKLWLLADKNENGVLDFNEFQGLFGASRQSPETALLAPVFARVQRAMTAQSRTPATVLGTADVDRDGQLVQQELRNALQEYFVSQTEIDAMFSAHQSGGKVNCTTLAQKIGAPIPPDLLRLDVPVGWTGRNLGTWAENLQSLRGLRAFTDAEAATLEAKFDKSLDGRVLVDRSMQLAPKAAAPAAAITDEDYNSLLYRIKEMIARLAVDTQHTFQLIDTDGDGSVDSNEMDAFLQKLPITLSAAERGAVFQPCRTR